MTQFDRIRPFSTPKKLRSGTDKLTFITNKVKTVVVVSTTIKVVSTTATIVGTTSTSSLISVWDAVERVLTAAAFLAMRGD